MTVLRATIISDREGHVTYVPGWVDQVGAYQQGDHGYLVYKLNNRWRPSPLLLRRREYLRYLLKGELP